MPANDNRDPDLLEIVDDEPRGGTEPRDLAQPWRVLVVDDDPQVHDATRLALQAAHILGRPLQLAHVYSAAEAEQLLATESDFAVALVDVVMESGDAGLTLVRAIREQLKLTQLRIILRTGQPGYAPELEVIRDYDINDYRTKSELSRTRLITSLTSALRSYDQICALDYSRRGLEKIVTASAELHENRGIKSFAEGVLTQIAGLIGAVPGGIVCARRGQPMVEAGGEDRDHFYVIAAMGDHADKINERLDRLGDARIEQAISEAMNRRRHLFAADHSVLYLHSKDHEEAVYVASGRPIQAVDQNLLEVFGSNITVGFSNVYLFHQLNRLAFHDVLTGLLNRQGLMDLYERLQTESPAERIVLLLDIDHFSEINDALGMGFGNEALLAVTRRLQNELPASAHVGRFGGDVLGVIADTSECSVEFVLQLFDMPFDIQGYQLPIRVTAGEASSSDNAGNSGLQVFQRAGMALSRAKRGPRGGFQRFVDDLAVECRRRLDMSSALKRALSTDQLQLHYQPKMDLDTGRVIGAEALLRWRTDLGESVPPSVFIPLAEQSGLILDIGSWVIEQACAQLGRWAGGSLDGLHLAINVSARQIMANMVVGPLRTAMQRHGIGPNRLEVEITESMVMDDFAKVTDCMTTLRGMGIAVALDDFGTGFSSLSYLQRLPIDALKVDRAFIRGIGVPGQTERIAEMIVALGKLLDLTTVAEGIETEQQEAMAKGWGCRIGQGFLYAPAMPLDEFEQWAAGRC